MNLSPSPLMVRLVLLTPPTTLPLGGPPPAGPTELRPADRTSHRPQRHQRGPGTDVPPAP